MKKLLPLLLITCVFSSCYTLYPPTVSVNPTISQYRYVYIIPTSAVTSGTSYTGTGYYTGVYGAGITKSINPADVIAGDLMQRGYAILPNLHEDKLEKTLVVSYGETGTRSVGLFSYTKEIILQFRDAKTGDLVCSSKAEGIGSTEADDIVQAIKRALQGIFTNAQPYFNK